MLVARAAPKLVLPPEPMKRHAAAGTLPILARTFTRDDEEPVVDTVGRLATVFPRSDVRLSVSGHTAKPPAEWLDRAGERYDVERARLIVSTVPPRSGKVLVEVLRAP